MKNIAILGSTGSIGVSALDVISHFRDDFRVVGLAAGTNIEKLAEQIERFAPRIVSVARREDAATLRERLGAKAAKVTILSGPGGPTELVGDSDIDFALTAMVGAIGLGPTIKAIERGIEVGIANKEPLVAAGKLCTELARQHGATLLPIDSEHNAIYQCLAGQRHADVQRLILTCSGGPFRQLADLNGVTRAQALKHPTWSMGPKITIDSATLMNKGLEVVEAHWLFGLPADQIQIIIHPQSVIHSMVEYVDGSVLAQLGTPDMRVPIGYALGHPARLPLPIPKLSFSELTQLSFEQPDFDRFPCPRLAYAALEAGGTAPAVLNAANEIAVAAFLADQIRFAQIPELIERVLDTHRPTPADALESIVEADGWARDEARSLIEKGSVAGGS